MKSESKHLFELINALSKSEKRYFKIFTQRVSGQNANNCVLLFDAIERQGKYNENALKKQFEKHHFVKRFPATKHYLHQLILKSLTAYHKEISAEAEIKELLTATEILFEKMLFDQCGLLLKKARKMVYKYELDLYLASINEWESRVMRMQLFNGISEIQLDEKMHEQRLSLEKVSDSAFFSHIYDRLFLIIKRQGWPLDAKGAEATRNLIQQAIAYDAMQKTRGTAASYYYHFCLGVDGMIKNNYPVSYGHFKTGINFLRIQLKRQNKYKEVYPFLLYRAFLHNLTLCASSFREYENCIKYIEELKRIAPISEIIRYKVFVSVSRLELEIYFITANLNDAMLVVKEMEHRLAETVTYRELLLLYYHFAVIYFGKSDYKNSLHWINQVLNNENIRKVPDIEGRAKWIQLILLFELKNFDIVPYLSRSLYRKLSKEKKLPGHEKVMFQLINKLIDNKDSEQPKKLFKALNEELWNTHPRKTGNYEMMDFVLLSTWAESNLKGEPYEKCLEQTARKL